nr:hypothetical protein [uncultured Butyricicoccus sp.]
MPEIYAGVKKMRRSIVRSKRHARAVCFGVVWMIVYVMPLSVGAF